MLLEWVVPAECPTEREVVAHVTSLAGEAVTAQPLRVWAHVVRVENTGRTSARGADGGPSDAEPARWRLELRIGREDEKPRVLESNECRKLAEATAFIVALDLQSRAEANAHEPAPPAPSPAPSAPPPTRHEPAPSTAPPSRQVPASPKARAPTMLHGGLGADVGGDLGTLPAIAWTGGVFGYLGYGSLRGELAGTFWPRNRATVTTPRGAGASLSLHTLSARACWTPIAFARIDACVRLEGGVTHASGFGIRRPITSDGAWFAGLVGLTARPFDVGPVSPRATVELGTPLRYSAVTIEGIGQVYSPSPVLFRFSLGLETKLF